MLEALLTEGDYPAVIVQGATGRVARQQIALMRGHGTRIVAGVSKGTAREVDAMPVFMTCAEAVAATGARASVALVPPFAVLPALEEALAAGVRLVVSVTEGMPVHDALRAAQLARDAGAVWIGPSTPGLAVPGRFKLGFLPEVTLAPGPLAVLSKSGTLSYELCLRLVGRGIGQSIWVGVGGDPVKGTRFADLLPFLAAHPPSLGVLVIGEIGGTEEEELAEALGRHAFAKPVFAVLAGSRAPEGVTMGHAGALIQGGRGSLASKVAALEGAGATVFTTLPDAVDTIAQRVAEIST